MNPEQWFSKPYPVEPQERLFPDGRLSKPFCCYIGLNSYERQGT
jgi:hypothetical protein